MVASIVACLKVTRTDTRASASNSWKHKTLWQCLEQNSRFSPKRNYAHSPLRITGSLAAVGLTPSISILSEPIIQSMWIRLLLPPCAAICSGVSLAPSTKHLVALAERDVAGGVLVEQRVVEQDAALRDRRGMRHQRHLAEPARALVGVEHLLQHFLAARSPWPRRCGPPSKRTAISSISVP